MTYWYVGIIVKNEQSGRCFEGQDKKIGLLSNFYELWGFFSSKVHVQKKEPKTVVFHKIILTTNSNYWFGEELGVTRNQPACIATGKLGWFYKMYRHIWQMYSKSNVARAFKYRNTTSFSENPWIMNLWQLGQNSGEFSLCVACPSTVP